MLHEDIDAEKLSLMSEPEKIAFIESMDGPRLEALMHSWRFMGREEQRAPTGDWQTWLFLAGRGAGKTRAGVEWVRRKIKTGSRYVGLIAPTTSDCRDVMIEGESGILNHAWRFDVDERGRQIGIPIFEPSKRRLTWGNGAIARYYSAEEPDRLRGPQHDAIWADELASWKEPKNATRNSRAWDMAMFGLRLGTRPQVMVSTTPKPIPIIRELLAQAGGKRPTCVLTTATTYANRKFLADSFFDKIIHKYEGTRLGMQELLGKLIEEAEGALWTREVVDASHDHQHSDLARVVVGVDPAVSATATSALTGIVVCGRGIDGRGYVLEDLSGRYSPDGWARKVLHAYDEHGADRIVAEGNQGGDLVRTNLNTARADLPISIVHASRSKQARAEPVAALYEQRRITHLDGVDFTELEDQLCTWEPLSGDPSPDRLDALVWAFTDLMLNAYNEQTWWPAIYSGTPRHIPGQ
jgi:phage terminase large subunit-like protein